MKILYEEKRNLLAEWHEEFDDVYCSKSMSPKVVQALCSKLMGGSVVYKMSSTGEIVEVDFKGEFSIESVLYHLCGIVYPQSRWLSSYLLDLLHSTDLKPENKPKVIEECIYILDCSVCDKQKDLLTMLVEKFLMDLDVEGCKEVE